MLKLRGFLSTALFFLVLSSSASAITWVPEDFVCPVDNEKNTFLVVASYGSYIYSYPSKYQWLFFPVTDSPTYYLCKKCHLATYMWDFKELPKDKIVAIRATLKSITAPKPFEKYTEVSVVERLAIIEKVYTQLGKDEEWWERFYRTQGYHLAKAGEQEKAAVARKKSLELVKKFLKDEKNETSKKLLLYISGAMNHFIGDDKAAILDFEAAQKTIFAEKGTSEDDLKAGEAGLNERIKDYLALIKTPGKEPRQSDSKSSGDH